MPTSRRIGSLLALVLTASLPAFAREAVPTFSTTARSVRVPVSVQGDDGAPVLGLRGEDFKVSEDGRPQSITFFSGERRPIRIALALDVSLSMTGKIDEVEKALRHFIDLLEPADEILVITFADEVYVHDDFTSDRDQLERVLERLKPVPGTALYDAAMEAIRRVAPGAAESKAVVLVTDGMDKSSRATLADVRELARMHQVPIFSIGIGGGDASLKLGRPRSRPGRGRWPGGGGRGGRPPIGGGWPGGGIDGLPGDGSGPGEPPWMTRGESDFDAGPLNALADDSGGRAVILKQAKRSPGEPDRLKAGVESIAITLRHRYLVGYHEPETGKAGWRKIRVEVDRPSVKVQARKGYYAGS